MASLVDALGLNIMRKDHIDNYRNSLENQRQKCFRWKWHIGFLLYLGSQVFGTTLALVFLPPIVVAPLGAAALIFNVLFSKLLVGTRITLNHLKGTLFVIIGSVLITSFSSYETSGLTLDRLLSLYNRIEFISYFSSLAVVCLMSFGYIVYLDLHTRKLTVSELQRFYLFKNMQKPQIKKFCGLIYSIVGGSVASQTLVLASTGVKLLQETVNGKNQFNSFSPFIILLIIIVSGVAQVYCMDRGLQLTDSSNVLPLFFALYSVFSFINTNMYYNQWSRFSYLAYSLICTGIINVIMGVYFITRSGSNETVLEDSESTNLLEDTVDITSDDD